MSNNNSPQLSSLCILFVDDDLLVQAVVSRMLARLGHKVDLAGGGAEGIEKFKNNIYDIIIMDVIMPVVSGIEAAKAMRAHELENGRKRTPILAVTAGATAEDEKNCLRAGMNGYMSKPLTPQKLASFLAYIEEDLL